MRAVGVAGRAQVPVANREDDGKGSFLPGLASVCMVPPGAGGDPLSWE